MIPIYDKTFQKNSIGAIMKLWEYFVIYEGMVMGTESGETLAASKETADGNVREYFSQRGQISSVTIRKINR